MNKALKKALSIGATLALVLCLIFTSTSSVFASYQDGTYGVGFSFTGGSGRGGVAGVSATVSGGYVTTLIITMTSGNYDYCYDPVTGAKVIASGSGDSVFYVNYPGNSFNLTADTTAMSAPHEITYTVYLDLSGIPQVPSGPSAEEIAKAELEKKLAAADELIGQIGEVSIGSKAAIESAREAVNAFSEEEQKGLKNLTVLEDAEKAFEAIEKKIADADALIEKIGDDIGIESEADIEAAKKAVSELTEDEAKELKNLAKLQSAEDIFKEVKEAAEKAAAEAARRREILSYVAAGAAVVLVLGGTIFFHLRKGKEQ
jgi:hypothetical protein